MLYNSATMWEESHCLDCSNIKLKTVPCDLKMMSSSARCKIKIFAMEFDLNLFYPVLDCHAS